MDTGDQTDRRLDKGDKRPIMSMSVESLDFSQSSTVEVDPDLGLYTNSTLDSFEGTKTIAKSKVLMSIKVEMVDQSVCYCAQSAYIGCRGCIRERK